MNSLKHSKSLGFVIALLLASLPVCAAECQLEKYAELPVTMTGTRPIISGSINGVDVRFLADSGAFFSILTFESAAKYQLKVGPLPYGMRVKGIGGIADAGKVTVKDFSLVGFGGGGVLHNIDFVVTGNSVLAGGAAGFIGQNVIGHADTEYDLANGFIRLFHAQDCGSKSLAYWHGVSAVAVVDIESRTALTPHIIGAAVLNGKKIRVVFDSGASHSMLTLRAAARVGIKPDNADVSAVGISTGLGKKAIETSIARFDDLDLGGEQIKNARLRLGDIDGVAGADMLLGADFFLSHRIYVAAKQHKLYFTYNGGRVFDLGGAKPAKEIAATALPSAESPVAANATTEVEENRDASMDAAGFRRRGAASAGRQDFQSAIADFDQAIKLDPADPENYYQRALALWHERRGILAMSDFDAALKIKPDHIHALLERGRLRLGMKNESGAREDFDAVTNLAPNDPEISYGIALAYEETRRFDEAIDRLNQWVAAYPKDERFTGALYNRCRSRTMTGKELDLALADCNAVMKKGPRSSQVFDGRGMVYLRLGEVDKSIADFKSSLKLQPKNALTLYGLGIAELKKGSKAEGDKNIQAAIAIAPNMAEFFKRLDLVP